MRIRLFLTTAATIAAMAVLSSQSDLDSLMSQVLERRDDNWKKLQQYTLEEQATFRLLGPMDKPIFGSEREYTWFPREGFFIRSPRRADGVEVSASERKRQEDDSLRRQQRREAARAKKAGAPPDEQDKSSNPTDIPDVIRQTIEPEFVQAAYFLDFKFESGHYALVGRERLLDRDVLRIDTTRSSCFGITTAMTPKKRPRRQKTTWRRMRQATRSARPHPNRANASPSGSNAR